MTTAFSTGFSTAADLDRALKEACGDAGIVGADLACAFVSSAHGAALEHVAEEVQRRLGPRAFLGCSVQGAIGGRTEVEGGPSLALWTATLPEATIETFHATTQHGPGGYTFTGLPETREKDTVLLFPDPFSTPLVEILASFPAGTMALGGVASGAPRPGGNRLFVDDRTHAEGCVGVVLRGVEIRPVVSQGCRPIGRPFVVTKAKQNILLTLAGKPAADRVKEILSGLSEDERPLVQQGLHVGCAIDEYKDRHTHGDFLVGNVMGVDPKSGALTVTHRLRVGQTIQFHLRDGASARRELQQLLVHAATPRDVKGVLLFACNGRGTNLFGEPHVDATIVQTVLGDIPLAGFFAGGEIGPVGGVNFVHGFTASLALFCA